MIERFENATVGDIVAGDFRTAAVFDRFGIDFCCGGRQTFPDACRQVAADPASVIRALRALPPAVFAAESVSDGPLDRLIDHIVTTHHAYVRGALLAIVRHLAALKQAHGERHPELSRITWLFAGLAAELTQHMRKEEQVLFPYVRDLLEHEEQLCGGLMCPFGTVENPIRMMEREHRDASDALNAIKDLTHGYAMPADGCTTYRVCMEELAQFERDLHVHVHLENNVLFPRAIALEERIGREAAAGSRGSVA